MLSFLEENIIFGNLLDDIKNICILEDSLVGKRSSSAPDVANKSSVAQKNREYSEKIRTQTYHDNEYKDEKLAVRERENKTAQFNAEQKAAKNQLNRRELDLQQNIKQVSKTDNGVVNHNSSLAEDNVPQQEIISTDTDPRISPNLTSEKKAYKNLKWQKISRGDPEVTKKTALVNSEGRSNVINNTFSTTLYKGSAGIALKYFLDVKLSDEEDDSEEKIIARDLMSNDTRVKNTVQQIKVLLNKFKIRKDDENDKQKLLILKSQFSQLFQHFKEEYNRKVKG